MNSDVFQPAYRLYVIPQTKNRNTLLPNWQITCSKGSNKSKTKVNILYTYTKEYSELFCCLFLFAWINSE